MSHTREDTGGVLWLPRSVLTELEQEADRMSPTETGGVLMGYWAHAPSQSATAAERDVVVTAALGPGPCADHRRDSFTPDHDHQEQEIATLYVRSGRRWTYLGDWHTHPEGLGTVSRRDEATIERISLAAEARAPNPIMLILAGGDHWTAHAWVARRTKRNAWWRSRLVPVRLSLRVIS